jgi:hypothetical protein
MTAITTFPLPDGPLIGCDQVITERAALIYRMAREILAAGTYGDYRDSILTLAKSGAYSRFDILTLIDDARQVAAQHSKDMREMIGG